MNTNGAFLISRSIFNSEIWLMPPYYIKLWVWLIGKCNHKGVVLFGQEFNRGECLVTLAETRNQTKYKVGWRTQKISKKEAWSFYEWLREGKMVTTTKTTKGMFVKVLNYDRYQSLRNYEGNKEGTAPVTRREQTGNTINKNVKNDKNVKNILSKDNRKHPDPRINTLINFLQEKIGGLDNSVTDNRRYCYLLLNKFTKEFPDKDPVDGIQAVIELGLQDNFHAKNLTSFRYVFYNFRKIINTYQTKKNNVIFIS